MKNAIAGIILIALSAVSGAAQAHLTPFHGTIHATSGALQDMAQDFGPASAQLGRDYLQAAARTESRAGESRSLHRSNFGLYQNPAGTSLLLSKPVTKQACCEARLLLPPASVSFTSATNCLSVNGLARK